MTCFLEWPPYTGSLPSNFMANSKFKSEKVTIFVQHNEITGTIPTGLMQLENLYLNLVGNMIKNMPKELCQINGVVGVTFQRLRTN